MADTAISRMVRCWLLPILAALVTATVIDLGLILYEAGGPASSTHYGALQGWLALVPQLVAGTFIRVLLPASALCSILYLLRTSTPPFRYPTLAGFGLCLVWIGAMLVALPPHAATITRITIGPGAPFLPPAADAWPPFGPAYFPYIEVLVALGSAVLATWLLQPGTRR